MIRIFFRLRSLQSDLLHNHLALLGKLGLVVCLVHHLQPFDLIIAILIRDKLS